MIELRYSAGKVWANYLCAVTGGLVIVVVIGSLWDRAALTGGIGGLIAVAVMLVFGAIKRSARQEPFLVVDGNGITVVLLGIGTIPWSQIRSTRLSGIPWVTGQRLIVEYAGTAPKVGFVDKLNWGLQAKQRGEVVRMSIGFIDMTDQSKSNVEAALNRPAPRTA